MSLIFFLAISGAVLVAGYRWYGAFLARFIGLSNSSDTPAHAQRDGLDYEPARMSWLLPQHFSAIAAAGPIVGPILAATYFGWFPAWLWIIFGSIFIGGVHDFTTLVASVRHKARSIAEVVRCYMNRRSYLLFLVFIWISLIYVIIAFADVTAGTFVQKASAADAAAPGPAVATSSILYLCLAVIMGLCLRHTKLGQKRAQLIFLPLVVLAIAIGPSIPLDIGALTGAARPQVVWDWILLGYCFFAAMSPMWLLLQPRGALGGYFLYVVIILGVLGIVIGGLTGQIGIAAPAVASGANLFSYNGTTPPMLPVLFITIACGACSGFHSIVASGTTSKQLDRETDARPVAYGGMLLEGFFACISLATVMILAKPTGRPDLTYADGVAVFMNQATFGVVSVDIARQFGLLCFATFVFDTLDACTRLARYVLMEITGWTGRVDVVAATALSLALPLIVVSLPPAEVGGQALPIWRVFWNLFGTSNQLLAALALLAVTVWMRHRGKAVWVTLGPTVLMLVMTVWSLGLALSVHLDRINAGSVAMVHHVEFGVAALLLGLAVWLVIEALLLARVRPPGTPEPEPVPGAA